MSLFILGMLWGMSHALEADHVLSISSMVERKMSAKKLTSLGLFWGLGHTVTLLIITSLVVFFNVVISDRLGDILEFSVGVVLVFLGIDVFLRMRKNRIHFHVHSHRDGVVHFHAHRHAREGGEHVGKVPVHDHEHHSLGWRSKMKPFLVGLLHGAAGSSALLSLALLVAEDDFIKIMYVLFFGIGSLMGMSLISLTLSWPIKRMSGMTDRKFTRFYRVLNYALSLGTIVFGFLIMVRSRGDIF